MSVLLFRSLGGFKTHRFSSSVHFYTLQLLNGWLPIKSSSRPTGLSSAAWHPETYLTFVWWRWMPEGAAIPSLWHSPPPSRRLWVSVCALLDLHVWGTDESERMSPVTSQGLITSNTDYFIVLYILSVFSEPWLMWLTARAQMTVCVSPPRGERWKWTAYSL